MKGNAYNSTQEKLEIVLSIVKKLSNFNASDMSKSINLYNDSYPAIAQLKSVFNEYIKTDITSSMSGKIKFPEINKTIEYILPAKTHVQPMFVLRHSKH
jgi:hypothetical protein